MKKFREMVKMYEQSRGVRIELLKIRRTLEAVSSARSTGSIHVQGENVFLVFSAFYEFIMTIQIHSF